jgi:hypothetical protein
MNCVLRLACCVLFSGGWSLAPAASLISMKQGSPPVRPIDRTAAAQFNREPATIPAGTHVVMKMTSPLHTTSATPGSAVYLETSFPVIVSDRLVIPEHTRVLGTMECERRPGRVRGRAQMRIRFTQLILPDGRVFSIVAQLQSLPGSRKQRTVDREGTIEPVDQIDADVYTLAKTTGAGVLLGSIGHTGVGVGNGALIGAGIGLATVLFTRGDEISLPVGTQVEMVLERPLSLPAKP